LTAEWTQTQKTVEGGPVNIKYFVGAISASGWITRKTVSGKTVAVSLMRLVSAKGWISRTGSDGFMLGHDVRISQMNNLISSGVSVNTGSFDR
jgi:hypothetical protein